MVMLMADEDTLAGPAHAIFLVMFFKSFQASDNGCVFFRLILFRAERVVAERVEADGFWLVRIKGFGDDWSVGGLEGGLRYG